MNASADTVTFFDSTYEEALKLTREARDYLAYQERSERAELEPAAKLVLACESMRMTARLTQVMAWLLVQKAVHAGEITRHEAAEPHNRLAGQGVCDQTEPVAEQALPPRLVELLDHSHRLYARVVRLDAMLDQAGS